MNMVKLLFYDNFDTFLRELFMKLEKKPYKLKISASSKNRKAFQLEQT
jgi:hypothetical protein